MKIRNLILKVKSKTKKIFKKESVLQKDKIIFVVPGLGNLWNGIGQQLFSDSLVFRNTIHKINQISNKKFNFNLLEAYTNQDFKTSKCTRKQMMLMQTSLQIGIIDLWKSKGIIPKAYLGTSWGLVAACYGAGGVNLKDVVHLIFIYHELHPYSIKKGKYIILDITKSKAEVLLLKSKGLLHFVSDTPRSRIFFFCEEKNTETVRILLAKENLNPIIFQFNYATHTPFLKDISKKNYFSEEFGVFENKSLQYNLYSSLDGETTFAGSTLTKNYWFQMITQPSLVKESFEKALADGYNIFLNVGFDNKLKKDISHISNLLDKKTKYFSTLLESEDETISINKTHLALAKLGFVENAKPIKNKTEFLPVNYSNLLDPNFVNNPYPLLRDMHNYNPVQYFEKHNFWLILDYDNVDFALKNPEIFSSCQGKTMDYVLLGAEPIDHIKSRKILAPYFSPKAIKKFSLVIREEANNLLKGSSNKEIDIVNDYAIPLTERIIARFIGLNEKELTEIQTILSTKNRYELNYFSELENYFYNYLESIPNGSESNFCAELLKEGGFTKTELTSILKLLWIAGTTTTSMLISSSVLILLKEPEVLNLVKNDTSKMQPFIEEVLRYESPEKTSWRITLSDITLSGVHIPKNSNIHLCLTSANRDPKYFDNPDYFNLNRKNTKKHLAFNSGPHYCIGAQLALLETKIAIEVLLEQSISMTLKTTEENIKYFSSSHFRSLESLNISLS